MVEAIFLGKFHHGDTESQSFTENRGLRLKSMENIDYIKLICYSVQLFARIVQKIQCGAVITAIHVLIGMVSSIKQSVLKNQDYKPI